MRQTNKNERGNKMNNSEKTHEINEKNTMTEKEMNDLFDWLNGKMINTEN